MAGESGSLLRNSDCDHHACDLPYHVPLLSILPYVCQGSPFPLQRDIHSWSSYILRNRIKVYGARFLLWASSVWMTSLSPSLYGKVTQLATRWLTSPWLPLSSKQVCIKTTCRNQGEIWRLYFWHLTSDLTFHWTKNKESSWDLVLSPCGFIHKCMGPKR